MQIMRRWRQKVTRKVIPALHCIFCGGPEEDTGHMRITCERDEVVARPLCAKVEEFTLDLPLADRAMVHVMEGAWVQVDRVPDGKGGPR